jgi:choline dehydrogenase-like flavoprotein
MIEKQATDVVVIGAGYAGLMAAMRIATKTDARTVAVTLVSASPNFNERVRNHQPRRPLTRPPNEAPSPDPGSRGERGGSAADASGAPSGFA